MKPRVQPPRLALVAFSHPESEALYRRLLLPCRFVVESASTGPQALARTLSLRPDVLIAETALAVIDGYVLRNLLRSDPETRDLPIVLITADDDGGAAQGGDERTVLLPASCVEEQLCQLVLALGAEPAADQRPQPVRARGARPALAPPELRCTRCDAPLLHERTYWGGVPRQPEQWDVYACPAGCGVFEYRHRTRTMRALPRNIPDVSARQTRIR